MFLQVGVLPSDQPSLHFLWREDPTTNVVVYQYTRHIFGAKDSPTCADYALQRTARDNAKFYPEAAKAVLENFYMDDYLDSVESPENAINRSKELVHLLHLGGFKLTKFVSNVPNLADRIDGSPQSTEPKVIVSCQEDSSHVLGLKWDHTNDTLVVSGGTSCAITKPLTQRLDLGLVSKVFGPIGLVAPFTVGLPFTGVSQDINGIMSSHRTWFKDFSFGVRTYQSLKTSKFLEVILLDPLIM